MIRHSYSALKQPPAPFVTVTLVHPYTGVEIRDVNAQIDTGADCTLLPLALVQALSLPRTSEVEVCGVGGTIELMDVYGVQIGLFSLPLLPVEVPAHAGEPWILLGRDILNDYRLVLDGPGLTLEIG